jgi:hypothetical protein
MLFLPLMNTTLHQSYQSGIGIKLLRWSLNCKPFHMSLNRFSLAVSFIEIIETSYRGPQSSILLKSFITNHYFSWLLLHNCYISSFFIILCTHLLFMILSVINHSSLVSSITSWWSPLQIVKVRILFVDAIASYSQFANALKLNCRSNQHVCKNLWPF